MKVFDLGNIQFHKLRNDKRRYNFFFEGNNSISALQEFSKKGELDILR